MSLFSAIYAGSALPQLMDNNGEPVEYIAPGGAKTRLTGVVSGEAVEEFDGEQGGRFKRYVREVVVFSDSRSSFGGIPEPQLAATMIVGGTKYAVEAVSIDTDASVRIMVSRTAAIEYTRPNLRQGRR